MTIDDCFWKLSTLSDQELEGRLESLVSSERSATARLVAHLAEVLDRRLHLTQAFGSMTAYCREKLRLREDDAGRRIVAARLGTRYPAIFPMLDSGELSLSVACKLKHYISEENHRELLEGVRGLTYREAEAWLAMKFPRVDVPSRVRKLPPRTPESSLQLESTASAMPKAPPSGEPSLAPLAGPAVAPVAAPATAPLALELASNIDPLHTIASKPNGFMVADTSSARLRSGAPSSGNPRPERSHPTTTPDRRSEHWGRDDTGLKRFDMWAVAPTDVAIFGRSFAPRCSGSRPSATERTPVARPQPRRRRLSRSGVLGR